jgi:hypothetical protein
LRRTTLLEAELVNCDSGPVEEPSYDASLENGL